MAQAAPPGDLGLPCSPQQALALYQHIFRCPAGLGQLRAALRQVREAGHCLRGSWLSVGPASTLPPQVQEGCACPSGLELPTVLLEMERSRRAQEQLLWDLELLTGAGLGLFWPPQAQFCGLRGRCAWSQHGKPRGRTGGSSEQLTSGSSRLCPSPQAGDSLSQNHQLPEWEQTADPAPALDLDEAGSETDPRRESPGLPAEPTPGCLQELNPTNNSRVGEPGSSDFKDLAHKEERNQAEATTQRPLPLSSGSLWGRKFAEEAPGAPGLSSQGLWETPGLGWSLVQDRAELQRLLRIEIPQSQREEEPQEQKEETRQGQRENTDQCPSGEATQPLREEVSGDLGRETPQGENKDALQGQRGDGPECQRKEALLELSKETPQGGEVKTLQSSGRRGQISQAWEEAQGEASTQPPEEGDSLGTPGYLCRSLGAQMPQPGRRESPGSWGRSTQLMQDKNDGQKREPALALGEQGALREEGPALLLSARPQDPPLLPGPGAVMHAALSTEGSEQREHPSALMGDPGRVSNQHRLQDPVGGPGPEDQQVGEEWGPQADGSTRLPGALGEWRGVAKGPKAWKAAWFGPPGRETSAGVSAAQQETALRRLLELHCAARRRRRQDREQQRLRVLERLRIARNRHCQVHPLVPPPSPAQLPSQEDAAGQRRALREQLQQVHRERTGRLRALGARNTQNFQQLLWPPGTEDSAPGE